MAFSVILFIHSKKLFVYMLRHTMGIEVSVDDHRFLCYGEDPGLVTLREEERERGGRKIERERKAEGYSEREVLSSVYIYIDR